MAKTEDLRSGYRMFHLGLEFAGATLILAIAGWLIDGQYDTAPYGALIGGSIGFIGGMYLFIKEAIAANNPPKPTGKQPPDPKPGNAADDEKTDNFNDLYKL